MEANIFISFEINHNVNIMDFRFQLWSSLKSKKNRNWCQNIKYKVEQTQPHVSMSKSLVYLGVSLRAWFFISKCLIYEVQLTFQRFHLISQRCPREKCQEKLKDKTSQISSNVTDFNIISWGFLWRGTSSKTLYYTSIALVWVGSKNFYLKCK